MDKKEFRKNALAQRKKIPKDVKNQKSQKIVKKIVESKEYALSDIIFAYAALEDEVNLDELITKALSDGKSVYLPKVEEDSMQFFKIKSLDDLEKGTFNVREPKAICKAFDDRIYDLISCQETDLNKSSKHQIITYTPGVAFTRKGDRMGYGKGYYDRFFEKYPNLLKIGIAFEEQIYPTTYSQEYDVGLDEVITA
ncbi:5-formyltetrahydrofolate cyclo-ligase [Lachnobacterium bovis]|uniref:5-formyltetrahydrofolate cyclo-ligase n=1 Tax=Lachnobacterium bovis TaxID=140626 RepID=UPI00048D50CB|nr:5-formyltetrahydrofolate cyclo-ligase [Lachnobacterium bovis]